MPRRRTNTRTKRPPQKKVFSESALASQKAPTQQGALSPRAGGRKSS